MIELRQSNNGYWSAELNETYIGLAFLADYYPVGCKYTARPLSAPETIELITNTRLPLTEQLRRKEPDDGKTAER